MRGGDMEQQTPAGWYQQEDGRQRYWDGDQWTEHFAPHTTVGGTSSSLNATPLAFWRRPVVWITAVAAFAALWWLVIFPATAGNNQETVAGAVPTIDTGASSSPAPTPVAETYVMPDLVDRDLQEARDQLLALGAAEVRTKDTSGKGRSQSKLSEWKVCIQSPRPGIDVATTSSVLLSSVRDDEACPADKPSPPPSPRLESEQPSAEPPAVEQPPAETMSQQQAIKRANAYLDFMAFSRTGLIEQLMYESFTEADATYAVDHISVDWNTQAALKAQDYLDFMAFSRDGLIEQLMFEGFTREQAEYGATAVGY